MIGLWIAAYLLGGVAGLLLLVVVIDMAIVTRWNWCERRNRERERTRMK